MRSFFVELLQMCAARSNRNLWTNFLKNNEKNSKKSEAIYSKLVNKISNGSCNKFCGRILGIDPSLRGTGLAVIEVKNQNDIELIFSKTLKIKQKESLLACTGYIFSEVSSAIEIYNPQICATEQTIYMQNFQTAQIMGISRGAVLAAIANNNVDVFEYAPLRIKKAICGYGRASKEQVSRMVQSILKINIDAGFDETDAIAIALCCYFSENI